MTTPSLVQKIGGNANSTTATATLAAAPTAGNELRAITTAQISRTVSMPSGWTQIASKTGSQVQLAVWQKTSDGSETSTTVTASVSGLLSILVSEWANASPNVDTPVTGNTASASSPLSYGPSGSPSDPNAVPFVAMSWRGHGSGYTPSSGWTWGGITSGSFSNSSFVYQTTAPNSAVSGTLTYTDVNENGFDFLWAAVWIPSPLPAALAGTADLTFTDTATPAGVGALIGSAALALAASAVIAAAGALSGSANLSTTATGVLRATGALLGNADLVYTATGVASSGVGVHGTADLVFTTAATIQAAGELSGYSGLAFTASGTPSASGALVGPAHFTFATSADIRAFGALAGDADISFAAQAKPTQGYPPDPRYFVQLAPRPFYAALESRSFLAQLSARTFYILSDPNMTPTFDTKDPRETVVLTFDASADLEAGETLTAVSNVDVTMMRGSDPDASAIVSEEVINPAQITVGSATIAAGHGVQAIASAGLTGCWYLIAITCATSNPDKILTLKGILQVSSS